MAEDAIASLHNDRAGRFRISPAPSEDAILRARDLGELGLGGSTFPRPTHTGVEVITLTVPGARDQ